MRFAVARDIITPAVKTYMAGVSSLNGQQFVGVHDDLYVRTLLLDDGRQSALFVTYDILMHDYALRETIADYVKSRYGIVGQNLIVSYSHSHAGPAIKGYDPGCASPEYEAFLLERTKSCIDRAFVNQAEGTLSFGWVEGDWNINRRKIVEGRVELAPNLSGKKDRRINILKLSGADGACRVLLLNFACHPLVMGETLWLSSEFPGRLCHLLETEFYGCTALFFQGAGANAHPLVWAGPNNDWKKCAYEDVDAMAQSMALSVRNALFLGKLRPITPDLAARQFVIELETEVYPKEFFQRVADSPTLPTVTPEEARGVLGRLRLLCMPPNNTSARNAARWVLEHYDSLDSKIAVHAGIVRLSPDLFMGWMCGEVFYEVKQEIEKVFSGKDLIFIGYGDGVAYIPDDNILNEGGYEADGSVVEFCLKGRLKKGINDKVCAAFSDNLKALLP
jgi:neutral ceramidase